MTFGDYLAQRRRSANLTLKELGQRTRLSPQFLNDLEHDRRAPSEAALEKLAAAFGVEEGLLRLRAGLVPAVVRAFIADIDDAALARVFLALRHAAAEEVTRVIVERREE